MTTPLYINEEDPIDFNGSLDATSNLQMLHGSDSLADYGQTTHAEHSDLDDPSGIVRVKLHDFTTGGTTWALSAVHNPGTGAITWSSGTSHVYYDFGPMTAEQAVDITAISNGSPPVTETRQILIKAGPTGSQPDHPRR